jgi:hypothetical protein
MTVVSLDGGSTNGAAACSNAKSAALSAALPRLPLGTWPDEEQRQREAAMRLLRRPELGSTPFFAGLKSAPAPKESANSRAREDVGPSLDTAFHDTGDAGGSDGCASTLLKVDHPEEGILLTQDQFLDYLPGPLQEESRCNNCHKRVRLDAWACPFCSTLLH